MGKKHKRRKKVVPKSAIETTRKKQAREQAHESSQNKHPTWLVGAMDMKGPWGFCPEANSDGSYAEDKAQEAIKTFSLIQHKLSSFERMKWHEILNRKNHEVLVAKISKQAKKRLNEIGQEDIDTLVSLRLGSKQRLWGIRYNEHFKILWWDPEHEVYASKKKHT